MLLTTFRQPKFSLEGANRRIVPAVCRGPDMLGGSASSAPGRFEIDVLLSSAIMTWGDPVTGKIDDTALDVVYVRANQRGGAKP